MAKCIVCDKTLESAKPSGVGLDNFSTFSEALEFDATGNYGSTIFDLPPTGERLRVFVCDSCIVNKKESVIRYQLRTERHIKIEKFDPN